MGEVGTLDEVGEDAGGPGRELPLHEEGAAEGAAEEFETAGVVGGVDEAQEVGEGVGGGLHEVVVRPLAEKPEAARRSGVEQG